jgi:hypothetical protein
LGADIGRVMDWFELESMSRTIFFAVANFSAHKIIINKNKTDGWLYKFKNVHI